MEVDAPFLQKIRWVRSQRQSKEILDLSGEDGYGDTTGKSHNDRVRDVLDDGSKTEKSEENQEQTSHQCRYRQTFHTIFLDNAIDDNDECSRRTTNLHFASTEDGDDETCYNGGDDTLFRGHARSDTECDGQRQGYDTNDDTCHEVRHECFLVVCL